MSQFPCQSNGGQFKNKPKAAFDSMGQAISQGLKIRARQIAQDAPFIVCGAFLCPCGKWHHTSKPQAKPFKVIQGFQIQSTKGNESELAKALAALIAEIQGK